MCKRIVGVDVSEGMVARFNERVNGQGIPADEMEAVCVDLLDESAPHSDLGLFDVVTVRIPLCLMY